MSIPTATYRLQLQAEFTLEHAADIVDYLYALGISHLYLSPIFEAVPGSTHGYDVTDPTRVREALGGRAAFERLAARAAALGMGLILDVVPNHMAASEHSPWWRDVLRHGRASAHADFFDIDWGSDGEPRLLLPILEHGLADTISAGLLRLERSDDEYLIRFHDRRLPVAAERCDPTDLAACESTDIDTRNAALRRILDCQHYRLEPWKLTAHRLGYRRFFDISDLVGVQVERDAVFEATHALIFELLRAHPLLGLRIDHVDGLRDPAAYLARLRTRTDAYLVVEKILQRDERLPQWPAHGTTGYDWLNLVNGLFIEPEGFEFLVAAYCRLTGETDGFEDVAYRKKYLIVEQLLGGERAALAALLRPLLGSEPALSDVLRLITELTAVLPVYRTYIDSREVSPADRAVLERALHELGRRAPDLPRPLLERLRSVLLLEHQQPDAALEFVRRWQQFSGPAMAKGLEDTALYVHTPLISANEVGGWPARPQTSVVEFHHRMQQRAREWPHTLNATATHDTKRGEDTRTRIDVLSELPHQWTHRFRAWVHRSEGRKEELASAAGLTEDSPVPNAKEESLLYQTLVGAWPSSERQDESFTARIKEYLRKAVREGKETTSWRRPEEDYETALARFVDDLLAEERLPALYRELEEFAQRVAWHGALNSLAQLVLKCVCPGVPDFYQGTELWSFALVDPDNRRPVDYATRRARLAALKPLLARPRAAHVTALLRDWQGGDIKLYLTAAALRFRRAHAELFNAGAYLPLAATGSRARHVVACARRHHDQAVIAVVPRLTAALCAPGELPGQEAWGDTEVLLTPELRHARLSDVFTGEQHEVAQVLPAAQVLRTCPVALLIAS